MKRIIFLIDSLQQGGMEKQLVYLVNGFYSQFDYEILLATFNPNSESNFYHELINHNIEIIDLSVKQKFSVPVLSFVSSALSVARKLSSLNGYSYVAYGINSSFILELSKFLFLQKSSKIIVSERNTDLLPLSLKRKFYLGLHFLADYIVPNSYRQANVVNKVYPRYSKKVKVINNYIDINHFCQKSYSYNEKELRILVLGRITHQKNPLVLAKALKLIKENTNYTVKVSWYGRIQDHDLYENLIQMIVRDDLDFNIYLPDSNTLKLFHSHDVICLPSFYEGFPNVLGEAIACGLPALVSFEAGDASTMVKENMNGFFFNCNDENELYSKILKFIKLDLCSKVQFGNASREIAEGIFSEALFLESYHNIIKA